MRHVGQSDTDDGSRARCWISPSTARPLCSWACASSTSAPRRSC